MVSQCNIRQQVFWKYNKVAEIIDAKWTEVRELPDPDFQATTEGLLYQPALLALRHNVRSAKHYLVSSRTNNRRTQTRPRLRLGLTSWQTVLG